MIVIVMGVTGSGKTTIGEMLAKRLGSEFADADDFHSAANKDKMHRGIPLTDADRRPWLETIAAEIDCWRRRGESGVVTCSALKRAYRSILIGERVDVALVYLKGSHDRIHRRMAARQEHFMPIALLDSQFAALEEPGPDERPITVAIDGRPAEIAAEVVARLEARV